MNKTAYFCISVLLFLASALQVEAQQLSCIEYFWDTDPGYNNATMVSNLPTTNGESVTIPLSTTNVAPGIHTLGIRAKNSNNIWGQTYRKTLSVGAKIKKIEYFWDTDPGIGLATAYTNFTPAEMVELNIPLSTAGTRPGMRRLGMRCMIDGDDWSQTYYKHVLVGSKVDKIEYYFDTDPGVGNATAYTDFTPFIPTDAVELNIPLSTTGIRPGMRRLGIRCMSDGDDWSQTHYKHVLVGGKIDKIEYYFDTDPGVGNATAYTDFTPFIPTDAVELNIPLSTTGIRPGMRRLSIRCMSDDYNWGRTHYKHVFVDGKIDQIEYYFDTDPGAGNAIAYTGFTPASQVEVDFDMMTNNISTGMHIVGIRSRSADGDWSHTYKHIVYKGGPIMYAEYFWDTDPGYEQGTSLSFTQADSVSISGEINTPTSYGKHILYLRARTDSTWSMLYSKEYCFGPKPEFSFMGNDTVCQNQEFIVFDNTEGANSSTIYKWDMNNDGTIEYNTQGSVVHSYTNIGTYTINLGVTNDPSCQNTYTKEITVISSAAPTVSVASNATAVCEGEEVVFVANSANAGIAPRLQWYRSDTVLAGATSDTLRVYDLKNRESIKVLLYNSNECSSVDSLFSSVKYVNVYSYPVVTINDVNKVYTTEDAFILSNRFGGTPAGGTYYINGVSAQYFMPSTAAPGIYELSYEYTNNRGCTSVAIDTFVLKVRETYSITANANNSNYGQVTGSGSYLEDNIVTLQAMPNTGYYFSHWSTGDSINPLTFAAESNGLYTAVFLPYSYNILAQSADTAQGQVTGGGIYAYSTEIDLQATAKYGYHFVQWNDGNTDNPRRIRVTGDSVFAAQFAPNSYTITVASANSAMGSVAGGGSYEYLSQATISATPSSGNYFSNWSDGNSDNPRIITVTKDSSFTAVFTQIPTFAVSLSSNYSERGTVAGGGSYLQGTTISISATPNTGYYFQNWSDGSTDNPRSITVNNDISLTANFLPYTYNITANSENSSMGTVSGSGSYEYNTTVSLQATAVAHYHFVQWTDGDTNNPRQVVVTNNATYTAQFAIDKHNVVAQSADNTKGSAQGSGEYDYNTTAIITAIANTGYHFTAWNDGNTDNPRNVIVTSDVTFTALFDTNTYTVVVNVNDNDMGSVSGVGIYKHGMSATLTATSSYGYFFSHWNDNNNDNPRTITVVQDTVLTAVFEAEEYAVSATSNDDRYGTVSGGGNYSYQTTATVTATANYGYVFATWNDGNTDNPRNIIVIKDTSLLAIFRLDTFTVAVSANSTEGNVSGAGNYAYLSEAVIEAVPNIGYHFEEWNDGNNVNPRTITVDKDTMFTALFAINEYDVVVTSADELKGFVTGSGTYNHGTIATISAVANSGYHFTSWNDGDTNAIRTITVVSDTSFAALFSINSYTLTVLANNDTMGIVTGSGVYTHGSTATLTAIANTNYHFVQWNDGNTNAVRTVNVTDNATYTATFAVNTYTVTVTSNDNVMGTVVGSGTYNYGSTTIITATANTGHHFVQWNDGDTNAVRTITVSSNVTYIATFAVNSYTVMASANDDAMGTVIGSGTYTHGATATITAMANTGHHFVQWNDGDTNATRTITVTSNVTYVATFAVNSYTVGVTANDNAMGTVSGGGVYPYSTQVDLFATANYGYHFTAWSDGNTANPRRVAVVCDSVFTANFAPNSYTITVASANTSMGSVAGDGSYEYLSQATISATPAYGNYFTNWSDGNSDNPRTIIVTKDSNFTAVFTQIPTFAISLLANYNERGTTNGGGSYLQGTTVTISATANTGYYFQSWSDGSTENPRSVTVTNNITLTANFAPHTYTITANSENSSMGTVLGSGTYDYNSTVSLQAIPITHYHFVQWSDGNTDNPRQVVVTSNATYTAQFTIDKHNVEVQSISEAMGRALGSGEYDYNSTATITAIANSGYHFTAWNDGNTTNPRTIVVTDDVSFTALFDTNSYTVTVNANDSDMGSVQGSGTYNHGNTAILTASSVYGYYFSHWNDNNNDNPRTITVVQDTTLTAIFEAEEYTIEAISNNEQYGTVFGGGSYPYQTTATLTATANHGYYFQSWSDGNTNNPRSIMVSSDTALIAIFQLDTFAVTVNTNNPQGGSTLGGGSYAYLSEAVIEAVPNIGYHFEEWNDGVYTNPRTIVVEQDTAFTALFAINEYNVTIACSNTTMGTTTGSGTYTHGTTITISAVANMGYHFVQWNDGNTNAIRTITITSDTNFTAMFDINSYNVTILSNDSTMGTVTGSGTYTHGSIATITAMANANYHFVQWNDGNTNAARTITITGDATYTANFAVNTYTVTVSANDNTMGVVTGSGTYNYGTTATITAIANTGYHFVRWNDGDTNAVRTISVSGNANYIATFAINTYTVTVSANDNTMGTAIGGGTYNHGDTVTITATAATGHHFVQWNDGNTNAIRTITVTSDVTYTAIFVVNTYSVTVSANDNTMGTVTGSGTYNYGSTTTITAIANTGYHFVQWSDGNTDNPRNIIVTGDVSYTAMFAEDQQAMYTIMVLSSNDSMGTVLGGGSYEIGTQVTIAAIPANGHRFVSWNDGNTDNPRVITVEGDAIYIATFEPITGVDNVDLLETLTFYPNPTSGTITFNRTDIRKVEVIDTWGREVAVYNDSYVIDISDLSKGYYTMRITTDNGVTIRKVIRN